MLGMHVLQLTTCTVSCACLQIHLIKKWRFILGEVRRIFWSFWSLGMPVLRIRRKAKSHASKGLSQVSKGQSQTFTGQTHGFERQLPPSWRHTPAKAIPVPPTTTSASRRATRLRGDIWWSRIGQIFCHQLPLCECCDHVQLSSKSVDKIGTMIEEGMMCDRLP